MDKLQAKLLKLKELLEKSIPTETGSDEPIDIRSKEAELEQHKNKPLLRDPEAHELEHISSLKNLKDVFAYAGANRIKLGMPEIDAVHERAYRGLPHTTRDEITSHYRPAYEKYLASYKPVSEGDKPMSFWRFYSTQHIDTPSSMKDQPAQTKKPAA